MSIKDLILADGPRGYWQQEEPGSTTMFDSSGNARHGTFENTSNLLFGEPSRVANDPLGRSIRYNGNGRGKIPAASWMNVTSMSIEVWVNVTNLSSIQTIAIRRGAGSIFGNVFQYRIVAGSPQLLVWTNVGLHTVGSGVNLSLGAHHLVATFKEAANGASDWVRHYVDGVQVSQYNHGGPNGSRLDTTVSPDFYIGYSAGFDSETPINLGIDEVAYYDKELSAARVAAHYANTAGRPLYVGSDKVQKIYLGETEVTGLKVGSLNNF